MFWSKIWFFLVAVVAAVAITIALVMPRPAERQAETEEKKRLRRACAVANIVLRDNARARIQLATEFAQAVRSLKLSDTLFEASKGEIISTEANATGRTELNKLLEDVSGTKPSFVILVDRKGRAVARAGGPDDKSYGDSLAGYYLIDDALDGYLRDDLWVLDGVLYRVAGAPVLTRQLEWAGAIVLGQAVDNDFVTKLGGAIEAQIGFYVDQDAVASSDSAPIHNEVVAHAETLRDGEPESDCGESETLSVSTGGHSYTAVSARLPGEAGALGAFYTVFLEEEDAGGFMGALAAAKKDDLSFDRFPWIPVIVLFLVIVGVGLALMVLETDRPLRRLNRDAVALGSGDIDRLAEDRHRGKFGSIARSVNIAIDKLHRDAKAARKDLDQLLGPTPEHSSAGAALPVAPAGPLPGPAKPPPPSEFKFSGDPLGIAPPPPSGGAAPKGAIPTPPPAPPVAAAPPPKPPAPPASATDIQVPPKPVALPDQAFAPPPPPTDAIDDDILGSSRKAPAPEPLDDEDSAVDEPPTRVFDGPDADSILEGSPTHAVANAPETAEHSYFQEIFQDFIDLKQECGENVDSLTFERFSSKLRQNRDALIAKHGCKSVKFQVYVKDGKAALKASPVR